METQERRGATEVSLYGPVTVTWYLFVNLLEGIVKRSVFTVRRDNIEISFSGADWKLKETKENTYFLGSSRPRHLESGREPECAHSFTPLLGAEGIRPN